MAEKLRRVAWAELSWQRYETIPWNQRYAGTPAEIASLLTAPSPKRLSLAEVCQHEEEIEQLQQVLTDQLAYDRQTSRY